MTQRGYERCCNDRVRFSLGLPVCFFFFFFSCREVRSGGVGFGAEFRAVGQVEQARDLNFWCGSVLAPHKKFQKNAKSFFAPQNQKLKRSEHLAPHKKFWLLTKNFTKFFSIFFLVRQLFFFRQKKFLRPKKHSTPKIPAWSPTAVLIGPNDA